MRKVTIGFLGNIYFDTRTFNLFKSLTDCGHNVSFIGYDWLTENFKSIEKDGIKITKLNKRVSLFFYLFFFISQLFDFIKNKCDIYFTADFYSLPAGVIAAKLIGAKVFYDSREIYTELPALTNHPGLKKLFMLIENFFIKRVDAVFTTGEMDSVYIEKLFKLDKTYLLRNLPLVNEKLKPIDYYKIYNVPAGAKIILYQGIIVPGRGIETCFGAVEKDEKLYLVILGGGEYIDYYKTLSAQFAIDNRVLFAGKILQSELLNYTAGAFAGLSIIDNISINNQYALPNKLFEYIMSGVPVIASNLQQMKKIIDEYEIGEVITGGGEDELIDIVNRWSNDPVHYNKLKENCNNAAKSLNWGKEFSNVKELFN